MMRSLFSGVAGLKTHQVKMDVIGNNIANVNTVGYKSSSVVFSDLMYQTTQNASGANAQTGRGGINPRQIGLGVKSAAIETNIETEGASQNTGNPFDIQIAGSNFFIVSDGSQNFFTRAGAFKIDGNGTLVMATNGYNVMGWQADEEGNIIKDTVSAMQPMKTENLTAPPEATTKAYMTGIIDKNDTNLDPAGMGLVSTIEFFDAEGYSYTAKFAFKQDVDANGLPIKDQYTMECIDILDSNAKTIFKDANGNDLPIDSSVAGAITRKDKAKEALYLADGTTKSSPLRVTYDNVQGTFKAIGATTNATPTDTTFILDPSKLTDANNAAINPSFSGPIEVNMTATQSVDNKGKSTIAGKAGTNGSADLGAGRSIGKMDSISIAQDGKITATYTNGITKILGQIAVASFANPSGLKKEGDNLYSATRNSGEFDGIGVDVTEDGGGFSTGVLEMSNVDLSTEFTEMITTQRGFQANSRIITVSDTLLEELVNLKR